ncbi:gliding motility protein [Thermocrinis sp.]|uniref:gliding motility protein n=1 Tax=Thermocrinis sp. TaxID=2024383 RepID=UPI002FDCF6C6
MIVDLEKKLIRLKVVYYRPAMSGKTTNLESISKLEGLQLTKIDTKGEKTLVFDFSTKKVPVSNMTASFALYTVPGQEIYKDIRLTVLKGEDLPKIGKRYEEVPVVIQYNKMDLENVLPFEVLEKEINKDRLTSVCASAIKGEGVKETFNMIESLLLSRLERILG